MDTGLMRTLTPEQRKVLEQSQKIARKVQHERYKNLSYRQMNNDPYKLCLWCNTPISGKESFCNDKCQDLHAKAEEEYWLKKRNEDERRWAR